MAGYIGKKAALTVGIAATVDELNYNDTGSAVGTVVASKTVTADANKDVASFRNITLTGELDAGSLDISGNADIDGTLETDALSLNGTAVTTTAAEINLIDGGTARGTTAIADGDGLLVNDAGTMRMTNVQTVKTYMTAGVGGGGMEFIASSGAISDGTASVAFTGFDASKYDSYKFYFLNVVPVTDDTKLVGRVSINGGSAYDSTAGNYRIGTADASGVHLHSNSGAGGASGDTTGVSGEMTALNPANTTGFRIFTVNVGFNPSDGATNIYYNVIATGYIANEGSAVNAIKFEMLSGNIESGEITMFGIVNS